MKIELDLTQNDLSMLDLVFTEYINRLRRDSPDNDVTSAHKITAQRFYELHKRIDSAVDLATPKSVTLNQAQWKAILAKLQDNPDRATMPDSAHELRRLTGFISVQTGIPIK